MNRTSKRDTIIYWLTTAAVCAVCLRRLSKPHQSEERPPRTGGLRNATNRYDGMLG